MAELFQGPAFDRILAQLAKRPLSAPPPRKPTAKHGHAAVPGTGPDGETCDSCAHLYRRRLSGTYLKCGLMRACWTRGSGSDVRAAYAACRQWTRKPESE